MKILFINTFDRQGGASQSCWRTLQALRASGQDVRMLVRDKKDDHLWIDSIGDSVFVNIRKKYLEIVERARFVSQEADKQYRFQFSLPFYGLDISEHPWVKEADVLHFHWIHRSFISTKTFQKLAKSGKKIVWSMHDMWAFTGGCHYAGACENFKESCGNCFQVKNPSNADLSNKILEHKKKNYPALNINYVASSDWLAETAKSSSLLKRERVSSLPTPIDTELFKPADKKWRGQN